MSSESMEQRGFVMWFRRTYPDVLIFHIPNGGARSIVTAVRLKDEGVVAGIPDLYIPAFGMWIEMKKKKGRVSPSQKKIFDYLTGIGHMVIIGYGAEDASRKVMEAILK